MTILQIFFVKKCKVPFINGSIILYIPARFYVKARKSN